MLWKPNKKNHQIKTNMNMQMQQQPRPHQRHNHHGHTLATQGTTVVAAWDIVKATTTTLISSKGEEIDLKHKSQKKKQYDACEFVVQILGQ